MGGYSLSISKNDAGGGGKCSVDFFKADFKTLAGVERCGSGKGDSDPATGPIFVVTGEKDTLRTSRLGMDSHKLSEF